MTPNGAHYLTILLAHLKQVVDQIPSAVYGCEAPSGVIRLYNQRAAELWGRHPTVGDTDELFCGAQVSSWGHRRLTSGCAWNEST